MYKSKIEREFELQTPFSFMKKVLTAALAEYMAEEEIKSNLNRLWIEIERQESQSLKAFLLFIFERERDNPFFEIKSNLEEAILNEIKQDLEAFDVLYNEINDLNAELALFDNELLDIDEQLLTEINKHFTDETSFSKDNTPLQPNLFKALLEQIDVLAIDFATELEENSSIKGEPALMPGELFIEKLTEAMNNKILEPTSGSLIAKRQLTDKLIGKSEDPHHKLIQKKFHKACQKAVCVNQLKSKTQKLMALDKESQSRNDNKKTVNQPPRLR